MKRRTSPLVPNADDLTMDGLVEAISQTHRYFSIQAGKAVNIALTLRNWVMGCFIQEYEQYGADRAQYGEQLLVRLADALAQKGMGHVAERDLRRFRQFYRTYPAIRQSLTAELQQALPSSRIRQSATAESASGDLVGKLSFTHFVELIQVENADKRAFYEIECVRGVWSVRELKVQAFSHEAAGQLNTYVTWYARHMMSAGDNPPVGILLCTQKDHALAEYALAGMDNQLFVSRYQLELPSKEALQGFLEQHLKDA